MTLTLDFQGLIFNSHILGKRKVRWLEMKQIWVGYNVEHTVGLLLGHSAWQTDRPSNASMWNSYSFHPFCPGMGYSFTDLGAVLSFSERLVLLPVRHSRLSPTALAPPWAPPPDLRRPQRVLRHEKLWNYVTWPAWENSNVFLFNWCLYSN